MISNGKTASDGSEEELDLKLIYQLIDHKPSVFIIINLILRKDLILQYCGICTSHSCTIYDIFYHFKSYFIYIPKDFGFEIFDAELWKYIPYLFF